MKNKTVNEPRLYIFKGSEKLVKEIKDWEYKSGNVKKEKVEKTKLPKYYKEGKTRPRCQMCNRLLSDVEYDLCLTCQDDMNG